MNQSLMFISHLQQQQIDLPNYKPYRHVRDWRDFSIARSIWHHKGHKYEFIMANEPQASVLPSSQSRVEAKQQKELMGNAAGHCPHTADIIVKPRQWLSVQLEVWFMKYSLRCVALRWAERAYTYGSANLAYAQAGAGSGWCINHRSSYWAYTEPVRLASWMLKPETGCPLHCPAYAASWFSKVCVVQGSRIPVHSS